MKKENYIGIAFLLLALTVLFVDNSFGQRSNSLQQRCPGVALIPYAKVEIERDGDINLIPCESKSVLFNGLPRLLNGLTAATQTFAVGAADTAGFSSSSVTATHTLNLPITAVSGASRTNYFPFFNGANTLAKSNFSFNPQSSEFLMDASSGAVSLQGNSFFVFQGGQSFLDFSKVAKNLDIQVFTATIGDLNGDQNQTSLTINDNNKTITLLGNLKFNRLIVGSGLTGNRTMDTTGGTVNFAAGSTSLTVTNSFVNISSIILITARTNDSTCHVKNYVPVAGSFTINMTSACTAETSVGFVVTN
jgi:hypothetical protein